MGRPVGSGKSRKKQPPGEQADPAPHRDKPKWDASIGGRGVVPLPGADADIFDPRPDEDHVAGVGEVQWFVK